MLISLFSLALYSYLMILGSHIVAARLLKEVWHFSSAYLDWWSNFSSLPSSFTLLYLLPAMIFTIVQIRLLKRAVLNG